MRVLSRVALATGGALILSFAAVPLVNAQTAPSPTTPPATPPATSPTPPATNPDERVKKELEKAKERAEKEAEKAKEKATKDAERLKKEAEKASRDTSRLAEKCKAQEARIKSLMTRLNTRGQKQLDVVTTISTRVQAFKTDKNLNVPNYDALVADVAAKKVAAQAAVDALKTAQITFKCDGTDPKGSASAFQEKMKAQHAAIRAYLTSVKHLLKAVKQAVGDKHGSPAPTPSPTPTTPPVTPPTPTTPPTPPSINPMPTPAPNTEGGN